MSNIRELSFDEIALVSGGNANSNWGLRANDAKNHAKRLVHCLY